MSRGGQLGLVVRLGVELPAAGRPSGLTLTLKFVGGLKWEKIRRLAGLSGYEGNLRQITYQSGVRRSAARTAGRDHGAWRRSGQRRPERRAAQP